MSFPIRLGQPTRRPGPGGFFRFGVHALVAGFKTNSVFYTQTDPKTNVTSVYKADVYSGEIRKLVDLPDTAHDRLHQRR